jgi:hypothetical protein
MDVIDEGPTRVSRERPPVSPLPLIAAFLLSGLTCGVVIGVAYASFFLFAALEGLGIPITLCLGAILVVRTEQSIVLLVTKWRPTAPRLILAGVPAAAFTIGVQHWLHVSSFIGRTLVVAAGLSVQALILHYFVCGLRLAWSRSAEEYSQRASQADPLCEDYGAQLDSRGCWQDQEALQARD